MDDSNDGDDGVGGDHGENETDDGASMSLKCRMPASKELLAQIASEIEMIRRLQDAECQNQKNCRHE